LATFTKNLLGKLFGRFSISTSATFFVVLGVVTIPSLIFVGFSFLHKAEVYVNQIAEDRLVNLRNSRAQILLNYFDSSAGVIQEFSTSATVLNGAIDLKDALPSASDNVFESLAEKKSMLEKARSSINRFYRGPYLDIFHEYNPESNEILDFIPQEENGILLQDAFIAKNTNPINERYKLLNSELVPSYSVFHEKYQAKFLEFLKRHGLYDVLLVDADSELVVYSALKEADFGISIRKSALRETGAFRVFEQAKKAKSGEVVVEDFSLYTPSLGRPIGFWATPIYLDKKILGVLIIKFETSVISNIITNNYSWKTDGLGASGEVLVTGSDGYLRNDSRSSFENPEKYIENLSQGNSKNKVQMYLQTNSNAVLQENKSLAFSEGVMGKKYFATYKSLNGNQVIGAYGPLRYGNLRWAISAEMDKQESSILANELNRYVWFSIIVISLLLIPVSYFITRLFLNPFNNLIETIRRIYTTKSLKLRLRGRFTKEVNVLIDSFNLMLDQLQHNEEVITAAKENIEDSITVAKRLLVGKLPPDQEFKNTFAASDILWRPRDAVGGDVYWLRDFGSRVYLACIDCTGHGVPGAFIAITVISALEQIPNTSYEWLELPYVIGAIHEEFQKKFTRTDFSDSFKDGFAISLICFDKQAESISFIGMGQDGVIKHADRSTTLMKGNRKSIGFDTEINPQNLQSFSSPWSSEDTYILYSDGLTTQVGDVKRKMMGTSYVLDQIDSINGNNPDSIVSGLTRTFDEWRGSLEARDDLTIMAVKPKPLK
jgi:serine phosphatase RsbU (regulator of sigma subunit)